MFIILFLTALIIIINAVAYVTLKVCNRFNYNTRIHLIIRNATIKIKDRIVWNGVIRYTITAYLKVAVLCVFNLKTLKYEPSAWVTGYTVLLFIMLVVYPL